MLDIQPMIVADAMEIKRQASQRVQLGLEREMTPEIAQDLIHGGEAWTILRDGVPIACVGLRETFPPVQGVAWAILADGIGGAHLTITRFARRRIAESPLIRIEAIVKCDHPADVLWAKLVGLAPIALLRKFGAASEDHMLFERIRG